MLVFCGYQDVFPTEGPVEPVWSMEAMTHRIMNWSVLLVLCTHTTHMIRIHNQINDPYLPKWPVSLESVEFNQKELLVAWGSGPVLCTVLTCGCVMEPSGLRTAKCSPESICIYADLTLLRPLNQMNLVICEMSAGVVWFVLCTTWHSEVLLVGTWYMFMYIHIAVVLNTPQITLYSHMPTIIKCANCLIKVLPTHTDRVMADGELYSLIESYQMPDFHASLTCTLCISPLTLYNSLMG